MLIAAFENWPEITVPRNLPDELGWIPFATIDREGQTHTAENQSFAHVSAQPFTDQEENDIQPPAAIIAATDKRR